MLKLLLIPLGLYLLVIALAFVVQGKLLFATGAAAPHGPLPAGAERLALTLPSGERLAGLHLPPARPGDPAAPLILGFGGNAWNADAAAEYLRDLYPASDILTFHYRGYAPSQGTPGAAALLADSLRVHDFAAARFQGRPIVAVGFSIGSGIAAHVAAKRPVRGLVMVTPFDSLTSVVADHYSWLPVRLLFRNPIDPARDLQGSHVPTAIIAAGGDTLVTAPRTEALRRVVPTLVYDRTIADAGHNDIYGRSDFQAAMHEALAAVSKAPPPAPSGKR
jgi:pimeloyl-ACP methyl ester carboxylesterase